MDHTFKLVFWVVGVLGIVGWLVAAHDLLATPTQIPITIQVTPSSLEKARELCKYVRETELRVNAAVYGAKGEFFSVPCRYLKENSSGD